MQAGLPITERHFRHSHRRPFCGTPPPPRWVKPNVVPDSPLTRPPRWTFLSNHAQTLIAIGTDPNARIREVAERLGITERSAQSIVNDLVTAGYLERERVGRRNTYRVNSRLPLRAAAVDLHEVAAILTSLIPWRATEDEAGTTALADPTADNDHEARLARALDEPHRLRLLAQSGLFTGERNAVLDRLTALASDVLRAPYALVSLVSDRQQLFKSGHGLPTELKQRPLPLTHSFCKHLVPYATPLVVADTLEAPLLAENPAVLRLGIRSYAGIPLTTKDGIVLGSFCVADQRPRQWSQAEVRLLSSIATTASAQVDHAIVTELLRRQVRRLAAAHEVVEAVAQADSFEAAMRAACDAVKTVVGCASVTVFVPDFDRHQQTALVDLDDSGENIEGLTRPLAESLSGHALTSGRQLVESNSSRHPGGAWGGNDEWTYESIIHTPILVDDHVVAAIGLYERPPHAFNHDDALLMHTIAQHLAVVVRMMRSR